MISVDLRNAVAIGVDLDLTLIDTRAATAHALRTVNEICGESIVVDAMIARLGPPIRRELARWIEPEKIERAVTIFRRSFVEEGLMLLEPMPGAVELSQALAKREIKLVVITSRILQIAKECLAKTNVMASVIVGGVTGTEKAAAMIEQRVAAYVGDHPLDMEGARYAGVPGIGVTTGAHSDADLIDNGACCVVSSLLEVARAVC